MVKRKIIDFLNKEWEKIKEEPRKVKEFVRRHGDAIDLLMVEAGEGGLASLAMSGLNPQIAFAFMIGTLGLWGTKMAWKEKKLYGTWLPEYEEMHKGKLRTII